MARIIKPLHGYISEKDGVSCRLYHYQAQNLDVVILGNQNWCAGEVGCAIHDSTVKKHSLFGG